jgi:hypothetical protein
VTATAIATPAPVVPTANAAPPEAAPAAPARKKVQAPGMTAPDGTQPVFGFAVESSSTGDFYGMGLRDPRYLEQGKGVTSSCGLLGTGNGGLTTSVLFSNPAFPSRAAAKAWMATNQYAQLKALLISLNYI